MNSHYFNSLNLKLSIVRLSHNDKRRALVLYRPPGQQNHIWQLDTAAESSQRGVLRIGGQQLAPFVHTRRPAALLALPGQDVPYTPGAMTGGQVLQHRVSYITALLIQSRGQVELNPCTGCQRRMLPFSECRRVPGHFGGCCGNCKWPDHGARCSFFDRNDRTVRAGTIELLDDDDDDDDGVEEVAAGASRGTAIEL